MRLSLKFAAALGCLVAAFSSGAAQADPYTYVGSWIVGNGPNWPTNPPVYSGQSAAALLFGGSASDYVTSTAGSAVATINDMAFYDGYGTGQIAAYQDDYSTSGVNGGTYSNYGSYSAYVHDNSCFNRYNNINDTCTGDGTQYVNYAFRVAAATAVPEPVSAALLGAGLLSLAVVRRRRRWGRGLGRPPILLRDQAVGA